MLPCAWYFKALHWKAALLILRTLRKSPLRTQLSLSALHSLCIIAWNKESITKTNIISVFLSHCCLYLPPHYLRLSSHLIFIIPCALHQFLLSPPPSLPSFLFNVFSPRHYPKKSTPCLPQVFRSACHGSDRQLWDSALGPGEDRQRHSARHPPLRPHCLPRSYHARAHTHTHTHTHAHADPLHFNTVHIIQESLLPLSVIHYSLSSSHNCLMLIVSSTHHYLPPPHLRHIVLY